MSNRMGFVRLMGFASTLPREGQRFASTLSEQYSAKSGFSGLIDTVVAIPTTAPITPKRISSWIRAAQKL